MKTNGLINKNKNDAQRTNRNIRQINIQHTNKECTNKQTKTLKTRRGKAEEEAKHKQWQIRTAQKDKQGQHKGGKQTKTKHKTQRTKHTNTKNGHTNTYKK